MYENRGVHAAARTESTSTAAISNTNAPAAPVPGSLGTMAGTVKAARALRMAGTAYFGEGMTMSNGPMHYRLSDHWTEGGDVVVEVEKFHVLRETPCGYWVVSDYYWHYQHTFPEEVENNKRWVPKLGSRYCHASIEDAKHHYSIRKRHELRHIQARLDKCQQVLDKWDSLHLESLERDNEVNLGVPGSRLFGRSINKIRPSVNPLWECPNKLSDFEKVYRHAVGEGFESTKELAKLIWEAAHSAQSQEGDPIV